jgi:isopenicillin N synthase-like dioxygenase
MLIDICYRQRMLRGPNIWPTEEDVPGDRATLEKYFQLCFDTNITLLHLILEGLGYPKDKLGVYDKWFRLDQGLEPMLLAKVSHYPPIREVDIATESEKREPKEWVQGCGPHTVGVPNCDWPMSSILYLILTYNPLQSNRRTPPSSPS